MKKFIFATVALSKLVFAQNNNENTQSYELEASVIEGSMMRIKNTAHHTQLEKDFCKAILAVMATSQAFYAPCQMCNMIMLN